MSSRGGGWSTIARLAPSPTGGATRWTPRASTSTLAMPNPRASSGGATAAAAPAVTTWRQRSIAPSRAWPRFRDRSIARKGPEPREAVPALVGLVSVRRLARGALLFPGDVPDQVVDVLAELRLVDLHPVQQGAHVAREGGHGDRLVDLGVGGAVELGELG